jgi:lysozyme
VLPLRLLVPLLSAAFLLGACGGSGNVSTTPVTSNSVAAGSGTATSSGQVAVPPVGPLSAGSITLPVVTAGSGATLTVRTSVGASSTQSADRRAAQSITNSTSFAQVTITANEAVTFTGAFTAAITYAGGPTTYFGTFQDNNGNLTSTPSLTSTGSAYAFTSPSGTYTLAAGQSVSFSFSSSETTNAAGPLKFGSPALTFVTTGATATQTDTVSESNYTGAFTVTSENVAIATATVSGGTITVTPVGAGTTSIDVAGATSGKISITVTTSPVTIQ